MVSKRPITNNDQHAQRPWNLYLQWGLRLLLFSLDGIDSFQGAKGGQPTPKMLFHFWPCFVGYLEQKPTQLRGRQIMGPPWIHLPLSLKCFEKLGPNFLLMYLCSALAILIEFHPLKPAENLSTMLWYAICCLRNLPGSSLICLWKACRLHALLYNWVCLLGSQWRAKVRKTWKVTSTGKMGIIGVLQAQESKNYWSDRYSI